MLSTQNLISSLLVCASLTPLAAQDLDVYWQANRKSKDVTKLSACGEVLLTVDLSSNIPSGQTSSAELRSAHMAPDGMVWVVNFIRPYLTMMDSDGKNIVNIPTNGGGNPYSMVFDKQGNAYVSSPGSASVVEVFDKTGKYLRSHAVGGTPLGITSDSDGNVWVSHRLTAPSKVTKIDLSTSPATLTDYPLPGSTTTLGGQIVAGYNGLLKKSDIFVCGDRSSELVHLNTAGTVVNVATLDPSSTTVGSLTIDANNNVWAGNYRNGSIYKYDPVAKTAITALTTAPNCLGLAIDSRGRLLATVRVDFTGPPPSEVRRININTNTVEQISVVGNGAGSAASSGFHRALVLDPFGDADGDGNANFSEVTGYTAPFDSQSNGANNLVAVGSHALGSMLDIEVRGTAGSKAVLAIALQKASPRLCVPGWKGCIDLDLTTLVPALFSYTVPGKLSVTIPNNAVLKGTPVYLQAGYDHGAGSPLTISNLECILPY